MGISRQSPRAFFDSSKEMVIADNGAIPAYDGSRLQYVRPMNTKIAFSSSDIPGKVSWNPGHTSATFMHSMHCYPVVTIITDESMVVNPDIFVLSGTSFRLDFNAVMSIPDEHPWTCVISYGAAYSDDPEDSTMRLYPDGDQERY